MEKALWIYIVVFWVAICLVGIACIRVAAKADIGTDDGTEE